jgi:hypothetical protein
MKSKVAMIGLLVILSVSLVGLPGLLTAQESGTKDCPMHAEKMAEKCCGSEMCKKIKSHRESMKSHVEKMSEHLAYMDTLKENKEWKVAIKKHKALLEEFRSEMTKCQSLCMMSHKKHGEKKEEGKEEGKE